MAEYKWKCPVRHFAKLMSQELKRYAVRKAVIIAAGGVLLILAGAFFYSVRRQHARVAAQKELRAIADLKSFQISHWREERLAEARLFARAGFAARGVGRLLEAPASVEARANVANWLSLLKGEDRCSAVMLFDGNFNRLLAMPETANESPGEVRELAAGALQSGDVVMGDLQQGQSNGLVHLDMLIPIFANAEPKQGGLIGLVLMELDPRQFLFPLLEMWPTPSRSAETMLVRQDGNDVLYLNELRHRAGTALKLRLPLSTPGRLSAKFLGGQTGILEGTDYRGVRVVDIGRRIPGTSWIMIAKMDEDELYAPVRQQMNTEVLVLGSLLLVCVLLVTLMWQRQLAKFLARELAMQKETQAQLAAAHRQFNAVLESMSDGYNSFDLEWRYTYVNAAAAKLVKRKAEDLLGRTLWEVWPNALNLPFGAEFRRAVTEKVPVRVEAFCPAPLNFWVEVRCWPTPEGASVFFTDITERRRIEEQFRIHLTAIQAAANAIVITGADGTIQWVNQAFTNLTGYSEAEAIGQNPRVLKSGKHESSFYAKMWEIILAGEVWQGEMVNKRKDGSFYTEEMTIAPVTDANGKIAHFVAVKQDMTSRKQAEEDLARSHEQLELLVGRRTVELRATIAELEHFSYTITHDLRSPLRAMNTYAVVLEKESGASLPPQAVEYLRRIKAAGSRMDMLIKDALNYSKALRSELSLHPVETGALLRGLIESYPDLHPPAAEIRVEFDRLLVRADESALTQCLSNLLGNAVKFVPPGTRPLVRVRAETKLDTVRIWVEDNGIGIPKEEQAIIFEMFQRLHGEDEYPGTGIGMALVRKVVQRMGGQVGLESEPGNGSRFWIELAKE